MPAVPLHSRGRAAALDDRRALGASARAFGSRARVSFSGARPSPMWASSSRALRRAARWTAGATAGVGALAGAQAFALHALYEALPDATGPTEGIAAPNTVLPAVAERPASPILAKAGREAREFFDRSVRPRLDRDRDDVLLRRAATRSSDASSTPPSKVRARPRTIATARPGPSSVHHAAPAPAPASAPSRVVVVLGDSLVTGVGASDAAAGYGPVLPRRVGERLAELTGERVEWIAVGKKAADAATIRREVVPALRRRVRGETTREGEDEENDERRRRRRRRRGSNVVRDGVRTDDARDAARRVDAVVLMCGVNDFKRAPWGRTPEAFRRELDALVDEVRDVVGDECLVVLPGMPMECATIFPPPLSYLAVAASDAWDDQKRRVAAEDRRRRRRDDEKNASPTTRRGGTDVVEGEEENRGGASAHASRRRSSSAPFSAPFRARTRYVEKPTVAQMVRFGPDVTAKDGIHPNEWGYAAWAHHIADEVHAAMSEGDGVTKGGGGGGSVEGNGDERCSKGGRVGGR